jgi:hypothetical protein
VILGHDGDNNKKVILEFMPTLKVNFRIGEKYKFLEKG